ncbi:hypothetical protein [Mycetocola zhadangensis]|uniref:hypothetical protein n=1 Tax=Mycetocola zhadangensis TaxID=1164595 RepID=UPI0015FEB9B5|nr:hypothetical protein [Mycetocola zhadangensis]
MTSESSLVLAVISEITGLSVAGIALRAWFGWSYHQRASREVREARRPVRLRRDGV